MSIIEQWTRVPAEYACFIFHFAMHPKEEVLKELGRAMADFHHRSAPMAVQYEAPRLALPAGRYVIYAGRGFEYSIAREEVERLIARVHDVLRPPARQRGR